VIPHINRDGLVIMDVAPEISALTGTQIPVSELVSAPVIAKRSAQSRVAIENGQTIVIGGLMEDRKTETVSKVPLLGDIPLLKWAFQRRQMTKSKTELLIFLTPHVAPEPKTLQGMSREETDGVKLVPEAIEPGTYQDHVQGVKRGERSSNEALESDRANRARREAEEIERAEEAERERREEDARGTGRRRSRTFSTEPAQTQPQQPQRRLFRPGEAIEPEPVDPGFPMQDDGFNGNFPGRFNDEVEDDPRFQQ
jgi:type II secretory pathway component HofQ